MTIDRAAYTFGQGNPAGCVPFGPEQNVPSERMACLLAELCGTGAKVLEIGTGSGYQTAMLAERFTDVVSVEAQPADIAPKLPAHVTLIHGDGCALDTSEEYDAVLVTFAAPQIFHVWWKQTREGGVLVVPLAIGGCCRVCVYRKRGGRLELEDIKAYGNFTNMVKLA